MIKFGTAGTPWSAKKRTSFDGVTRIRELGLDAMEVEFTHGVHMGNGTARQLREHAEEHNVSLSVHGPYFINLNAREAQKRKDSEKRILDSCEKGHLMGARNICFHPGFYLKQDPGQVFTTMYDELMALTEVVEKKGWDVRLCPETTGKPTQFGSWEELMLLCSDVPGLGMTLDFSHVYARVAGKVNYDDVFKRMKKELGASFLHDLHMHFSGIIYSEKGELKHCEMDECGEPGFKPIADAMKKWHLEGTAICESPNLETDSLKLKKML
ncbi:TIM barrel protein [archaeon]